MCIQARQEVQEVLKIGERVRGGGVWGAECGAMLAAKRLREPEWRMMYERRQRLPSFFGLK